MLIQAEYVCSTVLIVGIFLGAVAITVAKQAGQRRGQKGARRLNKAFVHLLKKYWQLTADFRAYREKMDATVIDLADELAAANTTIDKLIAERDVTVSNREAAIDQSIQLWRARRSLGFSPDNSNRPETPDDGTIRYWLGQ